MADIEARVVAPFLRNEAFQFKGYFLKPSEIKRIAVSQTDTSAESIAHRENLRMAGSGIFVSYSDEDVIQSNKFAKDITAEVFAKAKAGLGTKTAVKSSARTNLSKVFIVHGRDELAKVEAARFIEKLGLEAIILHEKPSAGKTIIEKIEEYTNVGFAVVLYTPCDQGNLQGEAPRPRARQNVVFEHGYLIGKLGRHNVCALVKGKVEVPNDISGVVYVDMDDKSAWHIGVAKELKAAGYAVDMNRVI